MYASDGFGVGARFSIPIVDNGFVSAINNSVAIGFGLDLLHYDSCWYNAPLQRELHSHPGRDAVELLRRARAGASSASRVSSSSTAFSRTARRSFACPGRPRVTSIEPALYLGGRYHFNDKMSLTMRVGFPSISIGVSFFP